jgi:hypothetical protein
LFITPPSARLAMGCLGTYGAAYSPPLRSPRPRPPPPLGGGRRPRSRGGAGVGLVLGRVPRVPSGTPAVETATAGLGAPRSRCAAGGVHCPVYRWAMSRCRRRDLGAGGPLGVYCGTFEPCTFFRRDSHRARSRQFACGIHVFGRVCAAVIAVWRAFICVWGVAPAAVAAFALASVGLAVALCVPRFRSASLLP